MPCPWPCTGADGEDDVAVQSVSRSSPRRPPSVWAAVARAGTSQPRCATTSRATGGRPRCQPAGRRRRSGRSSCVPTTRPTRLVSCSGHAVGGAGMKEFAALETVVDLEPAGGAEHGDPGVDALAGPCRRRPDARRGVGGRGRRRRRPRRRARRRRARRASTLSRRRYTPALDSFAPGPPDPTGGRCWQPPRPGPTTGRRKAGAKPRPPTRGWTATVSTSSSSSMLENLRAGNRRQRHGRPPRLRRARYGVPTLRRRGARGAVRIRPAPRVAARQRSRSTRRSSAHGERGLTRWLFETYVLPAAKE